MFSSAKYPAPEKLKDYSSIFTGAVDPASQKRPRYKVQSKLRPLDDKALQVSDAIIFLPLFLVMPESPSDWMYGG